MRCDHCHEPATERVVDEDENQTLTRTDHGSERLSGSRLRRHLGAAPPGQPAAPDEPLELCPGVRRRVVT